MEMGVVQHMTMLMKSHAALQADHKALQEEHAALKKTKKEQRAALRDELTRLDHVRENYTFLSIIFCDNQPENCWSSPPPSSPPPTHP